MTEAELARWKETIDIFIDVSAHINRASGAFIGKDYDAAVGHLQAAELTAAHLRTLLVQRNARGGP